MNENGTTINIVNIDNCILKPMSLRETRLHHWFLNKKNSQGYSQTNLAEMFNESDSVISNWINKGYGYSNCEKISGITGISEPELIIESAALAKEYEKSSDIKEISINFNTTIDLILKPMSLRETRFYHWYKTKIEEGETQVSLSKMFLESIANVNKWVNKQYSFKCCEKIAMVTGINEAELVVELVALKKYLKI